VPTGIETDIVVHIDTGFARLSCLEGLC